MKKLIDWILLLFRKEKSEYNLRVVSLLPENPKENVIYIEGNEKLNDYWYAFFKCPCGCNENIMLNLIDDVNPCWKVTNDKEGFSFYPSVWRTKNCKSHFWIRNSKIIWCSN